MFFLFFYYLRLIIASSQYIWFSLCVAFPLSFTLYLFYPEFLHVKHCMNNVGCIEQTWTLHTPLSPASPGGDPETPVAAAASPAGPEEALRYGVLPASSDQLHGRLGAPPQQLWEQAPRAGTGVRLLPAGRAQHHLGGESTAVLFTLGNRFVWMRPGSIEVSFVWICNRSVLSIRVVKSERYFPLAQFCDSKLTFCCDSVPKDVLSNLYNTLRLLM